MAKVEAKVEARVEAVTPLVAQAWLGKNDKNRNLRERVVAAYARDMKNGAWRLTGEAVKFSETGRLLDGQHRLLAVVQAGVDVNMLVVRGLPDDTQTVMDSGARRTASDALRLRDEPNYSTLAAAARLAILFTSDGPGVDTGGITITHTEILDFINTHKDLPVAVELALRFRTSIDVPMSVLSLACWQLSKVDRDGCEIFMVTLGDKTHLKKGDPILALLNRLTEIRRSGRRASRTDYLSLIFRAWNYWRTRKNVDSLPLRVRGGEVDIPVPR